MGYFNLQGDEIGYDEYCLLRRKHKAYKMTDSKNTRAKAYRRNIIKQTAILYNGKILDLSNVGFVSNDIEIEVTTSKRFDDKNPRKKYQTLVKCTDEGNPYNDYTRLNIDLEDAIRGHDEIVIDISVN